MPDSKISALTELTSLADSDELVVVDKSDTTMAVSGTNKRVKFSTLRVSGEAPRIVEYPEYAALAVGDDWTPAIQAALDAGRGEILVTENHDIAGRITKRGGRILRALSDGMGYPDYARGRLRCTAAGAGLDVSGGEAGGGIENLLIDGNSVATAPCVITDGGRLFKALSVIGSAQDNIKVRIAQNSQFDLCNTSRAARHNLVLDEGCGGLDFDNFQSYGAAQTDATGRGLKVLATAPGPYTAPSQIQFNGGRFEFCESAELEVVAGNQITFNGVHFHPDATYNGAAAAATYLGALASWIRFNGCYWPASCGISLELAAGAFAEINAGWFQSSVAGIHLPTGAFLQMGIPPFGYGLPIFSATSNLAGIIQPGYLLDGHIPRDIPIPFWTIPDLNTGFYFLAYGAVSSGGFLYSGGTQNEEVGWDVPMEKGTWDMWLKHSKGSDRGQYTPRLDGADAGSAMDGYNASVLDNQDSTVTGITVATSGIHRIGFKMATKHASSSAYFGAFHDLYLRRTGA